LHENRRRPDWAKHGRDLWPDRQLAPLLAPDAPVDALQACTEPAIGAFRECPRMGVDRADHGVTNMPLEDARYRARCIGRATVSARRTSALIEHPIIGRVPGRATQPEGWLLCASAA